jgi:hypothetical protein
MRVSSVIVPSFLLRQMRVEKQDQDLLLWDIKVHTNKDLGIIQDARVPLRQLLNG